MAAEEVAAIVVMIAYISVLRSSCKKLMKRNARG
jgi:hypothetical protein